MTDLPPQQVQCIAEVIYAEARGESIIGQRAVGHVILNRSRRNGRTPCQVIARPNQFHRVRVNYASEAWRVAQRLARNLGEDITLGALYFNPGSVRRYTYTVTIGNHRFYK